ncbi:MAG: NAD(P)/FAD-dependent oxidoreductase [Thermoleophilaceae bacterium]|nr:NAD(P)/FAD-dependent oxidoreductase [Thermoleophilaceae bacterium]
MIADRSDFGAVVVGASLAGCTTATLLARAGVRVALVERSRDAEAFKRVCGHYIQASAVPTLERLGLMEPIEAAGGVRSHGRLWTRWGVIEVPSDAALTRSVNLRRERLDPLVRRLAADESRVELMLGYAAKALLSDDGSVGGVEAVDPCGRRIRVRAPLVVGADGRDSRVAAMAGLPPRSSPHGRFSYAAYFEGPPPAGAPDATIWLLDPEWAAAFPTDGDLTMYGCMPTMERLPEFKRDAAGALEAFIAGLPGAPPIAQSRRVSPVIGKIKMPNVRRGPIGAGVALVGDAALATDPLWGVGCGWAFQSGEWLADSVAAALHGDESLERGLRRYRRRFRRGLAGHSFLIDDYATGRRFNGVERLLYSAGASDERVAARLLRFGTRSIGPMGLAPAYARAALVHARRPASGTPALSPLALRR